MSTDRKSPLEKDIQRTICEYLALKKFFFWRSNNIPVFGKNNAGAKTFRSLPKFTPRGLPDIIILHKGKFIAVEVKRPGAPLRPEQGEFGMKCELNGGFYRIVHSLEEILAITELQ
jgi:hypothetical protein